MTDEQEGALLRIYLHIFKVNTELDPDEELRVLTAIRQAGAEIPDDGSRPHAKWVIELMDRTNDLFRGLGRSGASTSPSLRSRFVSARHRVRRSGARLRSAPRGEDA